MKAERGKCFGNTRRCSAKAPSSSQASIFPQTTACSAPGLKRPPKYPLSRKGCKGIMLPTGAASEVTVCRQRTVVQSHKSQGTQTRLFRQYTDGPQSAEMQKMPVTRHSGTGSEHREMGKAQLCLGARDAARKQPTSHKARWTKLRQRRKQEQRQESTDSAGV